MWQNSRLNMEIVKMRTCKAGGKIMGKIIMCGSFKVGVGKSVTTYNLAYSLADMGKKVLAVDFDSQGKYSKYTRRMAGWI